MNIQVAILDEDFELDDATTVHQVVVAHGDDAARAWSYAAAAALEVLGP